MRTRFLLLTTVLSWLLLSGCGDGISGIGYKRTNNVIGPQCGDGNINVGEVCDDGNNVGGDGCSANCLSTEVCGNAITDPGEECDGESYCENCVDTRVTDADEDQDTISDFHEGRDDATDTDGDGTPDYLDTDSDGDGIPDAVEAGDTNVRTAPVDTDGDGTPDFRDDDSDGDGISDLIEGSTDMDSDGIPNFRDDDSDGDGIPDQVEGNSDRDSDGTPNYLDLDSDGDGISDAEEGIDDADSDGTPNYLDLDSDSDTISDLIEGNGDADGDGLPNYLDLDSDGDGLSDQSEGTADLDGDGIPNFLDLDSDGDGLLDGEETAAGLDPRNPDTDGDTISDGDDGLVDSDGDGTINALDLDSDGDGAPDAEEAGDADWRTVPVDTDLDRVPDFLDPDSDGDGLPDAQEPWCAGLGLSGRTRPDTDGDGFSDLSEITIGSDPCNPADTVTQGHGVEFFFELPYKGTQQHDFLYFSPTVQQVDVFFNVDMTGSMGGERTNLQSGLSTIMNSTRTRVTDSAFGVSQWEDYPYCGFGATGDRAYQLLQQPTTTTSVAQTAVNSLQLRNGADGPEAGFQSLYQVAVGTGTTGVIAYAQAGLIGGARFRIGSVPIVLHITDAPSHTYTDYFNCTSISNASIYTDAQTISALNAIGARVITIDSGTSTYYGDMSGQLTAISNGTNANLPVCAFKNTSNAWRCGANMCCTGLNGGGVAPVGGRCTLKYVISSTGTGLTDAVVDGIDGIVKYSTFNVYTTWRRDPANTTFDTSCFIKRVVATSYIAPPQEPEASCNPVATPAAFGGAPYNNGFTNFASGTSSASRPGSQLVFDVIAENINCAPPSTITNTYLVYIDVFDQITGTLLDTQIAFILVPPVL
ncbi:MAG: hypothetical protein CVU65_06635 [Deltaproteobacteria bacterium HGW-Deltaproteobacteria-22]|nr:MAG: hypothetical protein CVU65_06635 [Deltaproteobacteria bacterium HGW-Deltaproteobacteria-22]